MNKSVKLKKLLSSLIIELKSNRQFLVNPKTDFTRNKRLDFETVVKLVLLMGSGSLKDELYSWFELDSKTPTSSALIQQRNKILPEAFKWLFDTFNQKTSRNLVHKGYRLLAVDGSDIMISHDPKDKKTYVNTNNSKFNRPVKGYNLYHLNVIYDLLEHTYVDVDIQDYLDMDERAFLINFVDDYAMKKILYIADRGYESYNTFAHIIRSGNKFLIRCKDIHSNRSLSQGLMLGLEGEFDVDIERILTTKQTKEIKENPQLYRFLSTTSRFDFIDKDNPFYNIKFRVLRFKISEDTYEFIATNLERDLFPVEEIKKLYHMRWGIETSFRDLKYAAAMIAFHGKKRMFIQQEMYASLLFYNFCQRLIIDVIPRKVKSKKGYVYKINITQAFHNIKRFLKMKKGGKKPPDIETIIAREVEPVRPDRSDPRKIRRQQAQFFIYRLI